MWAYGLDWAGPGYGQLADACETEINMNYVQRFSPIANKHTPSRL